MRLDRMVLQRLCTAGAAVVGTALISISVTCAFSPHAASKMYGVPSSDVAWISSAGVRDFSLGFAVLALLRAQNIGALRIMIPCLAIVAVGDTCIVLQFGSGGLRAAAPHLLGGLALLIGSILFRIAYESTKEHSLMQRKRNT